MKKIKHKYQFVFVRDFVPQHNAHNKSQHDVIEILVQEGYIPISVRLREDMVSCLRILFLFYTLTLKILKIKSGSEVFFQFPFTNYLIFFKRLIRFKKLKLTVLIHDLESLRYEKTLSAKEIENFSYFDRIIALTRPMKDLLVQYGIESSKINILEIWDYLLGADYVAEAKSDIGYEICFAGNLDKSDFVQDLDELESTKLTFLIYGSLLTPSPIRFNDKIVYSGKFLPNDLSMLKGDWGLVWDGISIYSCEGPLGNYLKYNAPHKLSMYLANKIPVIVWSHSAIAETVKTNKLGIVVDSLIDIEPLISILNIDEYIEIIKSVDTFSRKIRNGEMLKNAIKE